ncbi:MAG: hypothetical protein HQL87_10995 [Magnetococcales bacterium]|nr:hypothetical protein [Magnetococcales bacterium]
MPDSVIPAKAGIQPTLGNAWIPACAGMTSELRVIPIPVMPAKAGIQESSWTKR